MKRERSNYHALHWFKTAEPRLRKALITNCKKELVNCISECVLNVLNCNIKLSGCNTRKLQNHKYELRKDADRHVSLSGSVRHIVQRGEFVLPLLGALLPRIASLVFRGPRKNIRCTSSRPNITIRVGTNEGAGAPRLASRNVAVEAANTIRTKRGLICVTSFATPIPDRKRRRKLSRIF